MQSWCVNLISQFIIKAAYLLAHHSATTYFWDWKSPLSYNLVFMAPSSTGLPYHRITPPFKEAIGLNPGTFFLVATCSTKLATAAHLHWTILMSSNQYNTVLTFITKDSLHSPTFCGMTVMTDLRKWVNSYIFIQTFRFLPKIILQSQGLCEKPPPPTNN